ncbi:restriction endonuclease subunit S [Pantoea sp. Taur]|uniref:restriction endonuclease subunit S n=1 Tax=Pantoea sp. Taur TaxID=2576757 RepID=UPI001353ED1D|nr:restriction endonuclease subunit S [Pantoea sp. Taur]MXP58292.1 restriction endonuclease subunit S [Pantoea sp. Taur]
MSVDYKVPEIRFKEFSGEWEKYPLGTFISSLDAGVSVNSGDRPANEKEFGILKTSCVTNGHFEPNENKVVFKTEEIKRLKEPVLKNTIIISRMNTPALVGANAYVSSGYANYFLPDRLWAAKPTSKGDLKFIAYMLGSDKGRLALSDLATGTSGSMKNISKPAVLRLELHSPEEKEQTQIGNYFQKLDALINQHHQKHDKLSNIKKAMLEKMFPKQGKTIPEIRFSEYSRGWTEVKLSMIADKITEKNTSVFFSETFTNSAEFGIISQRDYFDKDISNFNNINGYFVVQPEDFVYNPRISTLAPCGPIKRNTLGRVGVMSPLYTVFRTKDVNTIFIEYFFQTKLWHTFMFLNGDTGARADRFSIKDSVFFELPLLLPTLNEQVVIGKYFQNLDILISQHQQQITKLNNIKQACLRKMFV